jgi:hypothetical protein
MSCDELAPMPKEIPTDSFKEERCDRGGGLLNSRMFLRETIESTLIPSR